MTTRFELPEELTIYTAVETRDALLAWLGGLGADVPALSVSGKRVREVDGAGVQLLLSLSHQQQTWRFDEPSQVLIDTLQTMGLSDWLAQRR